MPQPRQVNEILKSREIPEEPAFYKHTLEDTTKTSERRERAREEGLTRTFNDQWRAGNWS